MMRYTIRCKGNAWKVAGKAEEYLADRDVTLIVCHESDGDVAVVKIAENYGILLEEFLVGRYGLGFATFEKNYTLY